jgi:hypothetical protein
MHAAKGRRWYASQDACLHLSLMPIDWIEKQVLEPELFEVGFEFVLFKPTVSVGVAFLF